VNEKIEQVDLGDESKRRRVTPLVVGSLNGADLEGGTNHLPVAMLLTVDPDGVPGFGEVLRRQSNGEEFDVTSRWASAVDRTGTHPPQLVLDFYLPGVDLGISIFIDVDEHPDSIRAAIRTGMVVIVDPEASLRLQREPLGKTLEDLRVFTVQPPDASPAIGVLQQRFDFPIEATAPERREVPPDDRMEALDRFFFEGRSLAGVAVQINGDSLSMIALIDPELSSVKAKIPEGAELEGEWAALTAGEHCIIAFDLAIDGSRIARWLIPDPDDEIVLAGSSGAHWVVMAEAPAGEGGYESWVDSSISMVVKQVEALRAVNIERVKNKLSDD
jgi:hypothetical protein